MSRLDLRKKGQIEPRNLFNITICVLLFASFMNLINRNYYWLFFAFIVFIVTPDRRFELNFSTFSLLVLGITMMLFDPERRESVTKLFQCLTFLMAYIMGCGFAKYNDPLENVAKSILKCIYLSAFGLFTHFLLNFYINYDMIQEASAERNTIDFWMNDVLSATAQASLACVGVAVAIAILFSENKVQQKIFAVVILVLAILYNLILAGRTLLVLMAVLILLATAFRSICYKRNTVKDLLIVSMIIVGLVVLYNANAFGVKDLFEGSNFYYRFYGETNMGVAEDSRFKYKLLYLKNFFKYPFGGTNNHAIVDHYAHDLYLDGYDQYGIFAFLAILAFVISSLVRLFKFLRIPQTSFQAKQLVLCTYVALNIQFFLEPIMQGMPFLFVAYCLIDGAVSNYLSKWSSEKHIEQGDSV